VVTEAQIAALEAGQREKEAHGELESECPGYCGAKDKFSVGTLKGVGWIYQQTFLDPYAKVGFATLYTDKTPVTAADLLNDRVLPFFTAHGIPVSRILTDRGTEYCGTPDISRQLGGGPGEADCVTARDHHDGQIVSWLSQLDFC
jgi:hypothetical protein